MTINNEDVKKRWTGYFKKLLNEEYLKEAVKDISWNESLINFINEKMVKAAKKTLKKEIAVGPDEVPVEV